ncbi:hypothetical protein DU19_0753 [Chlamydia muridarum]|nr:hypothetical protein DU17_0755 [Chlamydia muridarum]KDU81703.1 hypothetical protein DU18_0753 [Chlamydia muridarum]KDU82503.1 hypothetical protein DU19_0753 [Chlamydia muridarum]KDU83658.1 hypothetical protein DU20_0753 [Chlamydia muridarum]KDU84844.1 hypothetical protein DU21_0755 [Chlamydia muridarum]
MSGICISAKKIKNIFNKNCSLKDPLPNKKEKEDNIGQFSEENDLNYIFYEHVSIFFDSF